MASIYSPVATITNVVLRYPAVRKETHVRRVFRTAYGRERVYHLGVRLGSYPAQFLFTTNAQYASFLAIFRSCMTGTNSFGLSRDGTGTDSVSVRFVDSELEESIPFPGRHEVSVTLEEIPT
jgi:hypothetical protein